MWKTIQQSWKDSNKYLIVTKKSKGPPIKDVSSEGEGRGKEGGGPSKGDWVHKPQQWNEETKGGRGSKKLDLEETSFMDEP